jgi:hypothetical protein
MPRAIWRRIRLVHELKAENRRLSEQVSKLESELKQKRAIIGGMVQWIKLTHRLDLPVQPNTIRAAMDEAQNRMRATK